MSTFVLVHGAWQTASTWDLAVPLLKAAGHDVIVPTLSGLGLSEIPLSPAIDLQTHIEDIVRVLKSADLHDVTLVGHSYAGMIITGVAELASEQIKRLVYVDAFIPEDGQSALDLLPDPIREMFQKQAEAFGEGWRLPCGEGQLDLWGLKPGAARDFVQSKLCDFSLRCFEQSVALPCHAAGKLSRAFIACVATDYPARVVFSPFGEKAKREGWKYAEIATGHDCHAESPDMFVSILSGLN